MKTILSDIMYDHDIRNRDIEAVTTIHRTVLSEIKTGSRIPNAYQRIELKRCLVALVGKLKKEEEKQIIEWRKDEK